MEQFLERVEELLDARKDGRIDEAAFVSRGGQLLAALRDRGLAQDQVYQALHGRFVRYRDCDEAKSDLLAELMDLVVGFCAPHCRIWERGGAGAKTRGGDGENERNERAHSLP